MRNYFNKLHWNITRANNFLYFFTVAIQERCKSNIESFVSAVKFKKSFAKFIIPIALLKEFLS